ncbi:MAG TPA: hypothetical protein VJN43_01970 [Bryobacteraceae bacterium]|nr:hypothetical protein [Bryobacteraceae bacterium]
MQTVQLALGNAPYEEVLRDLLLHSESCQITTVDRPDPNKSGVLVVNDETLGCLPRPLDRPERVVLITHNDPGRLQRAWEAGIRSVAFDTDPPRTIMLAVMAAALRVRCPSDVNAQAHFTQSRAVSFPKREKTS